MYVINFLIGASLWWKTKYPVSSSFIGLAVDHFNHRLYWADPELSHIGSMRTDGSDPLVTISEKHGKVFNNETSTMNAHSFCSAQISQLFLMSLALITVYYSRLSAGISGISQPYRIDIFEDYIYGTGVKHEVFKIHKYGKQPVEFLNLGMAKPTNLLIYHRYKQQDGE